MSARIPYTNEQGLRCYRAHVTDDPAPRWPWWLLLGTVGLGLLLGFGAIA